MKMHAKDLENEAVTWLWRRGAFLGIQYIKRRRMSYLCYFHMLVAPRVTKEAHYRISPVCQGPECTNAP